MGWKILLPQEIMDEGEQLLVDAGHTLIRGRGFETEDVLADMKEHRPDAMIVRITPITREVIEANPNLKVVVRHGAGFDALDVKACHDNGVQKDYSKRQDSGYHRMRKYRKPSGRASAWHGNECPGL